MAKKIKQLNKSPYQKAKEMIETPRELIKKSRQRVSANLKIIGEDNEVVLQSDDETYNDKDLTNDYMKAMMM